MKIEEFNSDSIRILFSKASQAQSFSGIHNRNIKLMEKGLGVKINLRGNELYFRGNAESLDITKSFLDKVETVFEKREELTGEDISYLLDSTFSNGKISVYARNLKGFMTTHRGKTIRPKTDGQGKYLRAMEENVMTFAIGPAGTGKTYLAVAYAVHMLKSDEIDRIILTRPVVEAGEKLGFLPGDLKEKVDPYFRPIYDALFDMMGPDRVKKYLEKNIIEIAPLAYMRGRTLNRAFVILDEAQNTTRGQMKMFLTRIGENTKAVITGDKTQIDLYNKEYSGLWNISDILSDIKGISIINLRAKDVVRHSLIKSIIDAYTRYEESGVEE